MINIDKTLITSDFMNLIKPVGVKRKILFPALNPQKSEVARKVHFACMLIFGALLSLVTLGIGAILVHKFFTVYSDYKEDIKYQYKQLTSNPTPVPAAISCKDDEENFRTTSVTLIMSENDSEIYHSPSEEVEDLADVNLVDLFAQDPYEIVEEKNKNKPVGVTIPRLDLSKCVRKIDEVKIKGWKRTGFKIENLLSLLPSKQQVINTAVLGYIALYGAVILVESYNESRPGFYPS